MTATTPDITRFRALAAQPGVAIPVVRELELDGVDPLVAFAVLADGSTHAALLETSEAAVADADISIIAPTARAVLDGADVLDAVREACADTVADIGIELPRFIGGAIGMLAHEHVSRIEPRVGRAERAHPAGAPEAGFLLTDTILVFDHLHARTLAIHTVMVPEGGERLDPVAAYASALAQLDALEARLATLDAAPPAATASLLAKHVTEPFEGVRSNVGAERFEELVEAAREHVLDGECVQIVLSQRFDRELDADPLLAYRAVRAMSPAPYHVLLRMDDVHVIGASPEQLVGVHDERVVTHPIAGTRPRGATPEQDVELERELLADPKERSEHMMLVDLGRNDVGRIAEPGSVRVDRLCEIERYSHVMHLVSRVSGRLRAGLHPADALRSTFPAGTLTGAPKVRAMQLIAQLERDQRGPYGGVIGYVGHGRVLDAAITIRSVVLAGGVASVQAGAGIVAGSVPATEEAETRHKARAVLTALARAEQVHRDLARAATDTTTAAATVAS